MPVILAIETATEACSAALIIKDKKNEIIYKCFQLAPREHTKLILPMLDEVLAEGGIKLKHVDAIAFGQGPGAFTGLRIAAGIAQGLALSINKQVIAVSTLAALALQAVNAIAGACNDDVIVAALDARMGEVYWGVFKVANTGVELLADELVSKPDQMYYKLSEISKNNRVVLIGPGWDVYAAELFKEEKPENLIHIKNTFPSAEAIAKIAVDLLIEGKTVPIEDAQPVYIRNKVAEKSKK